MRSGINAKAEVKSKGDPRTVNLKVEEQWMSAMHDS